MNFQIKPTRGPAPIVLSALLVGAAVAVSGCSPTYGTGVSANEQLVKDMTGILSVGGERQPEIAYTPRAELVKPSSLAVLPEPQQDMASTDNPEWPESPEQRRARLRAEATANQDNPAYRSPITGTPGSVVEYRRPPGVSPTFDDPDKSMNSPMASLQQGRAAEVKQRIRDSKQGDPTTRKFLSEPPTDYRRPEASAPADELGVDEWKKEQQARRSAAGGRSWRDLVPWL